MTSTPDKGAEAGLLVTVPRDQLVTLCQSLALKSLHPGEGEALINCWIKASDAERLATPPEPARKAGVGSVEVPVEVIAAAKRVRRLNRAHTARNGFTEPGNDVRLIVNHILNGATR